MIPSETWANAVWAMRNADRAFGERPKAVLPQEVSLLVQSQTNCVFIGGGPTEYFSAKMPVPSSSDENLPIDELYGRYFSEQRAIEIYISRIEQDAPLFGAEPEELAEIVRVHEYAHAVAHVGVTVECVRERLRTFGECGKTDWPAFSGRRDEWFANVPDAVHELLAQAITYGALRSLVPETKSERLCQVFDALEARQPALYKLPAGVKEAAASIDWPLVLDAAREEIPAGHEEGFSLLAGITTLLSNPTYRQPNKRP